MMKNEILICYLPTANFFYFRKDNFYIPIANAVSQATHAPTTKSLLIVSKESPIHHLGELKEKTYGFIHRYCTSSYFSIALLLWKNKFSIHRFFSSLKEVGPWQKQIDAVISGEVDATMVPDDVWHKLSSNEKTTRVIATEENLPSPLILVNDKIDPTLLATLKNLLFSYSHQGMFNGFVPFQKALTEQFFIESAEAFKEYSDG